ncbi:MAG: Mur ligase domain-containing protein, partial [Alphaproteobacteria bacterium]|nr:Mur ligase domain-containing protein [Alphaproteobacteria bacterium]
MTRAGDSDLEITGLSSNSRLVKPGHLFAAFSGSRADGAQFIAHAARQGAAAVLASPAATEACA